MNPAERFGIMIKKAREARFLTQVNLAKDLKVSRQNLHNWEKGKVSMNLSLAVHIAQRLQIDLNQLLITDQGLTGGQ